MGVQVEQREVFNIKHRASYLRGSFSSDTGKCFICGMSAISLPKGDVWTIQVYVDFPKAVEAMFSKTGSYAHTRWIDGTNGNCKVGVCDEHKPNLIKLCRLVSNNGGFITPSVIQLAMDGSWFFEMPITFVIRQRTRSGAIELCRLQNSIPTLMAEVPFDSRQASQVTNWLSTILAVCLPRKSDDDFFPGLEEKLQGVLDQQADTENPR